MKKTLALLLAVSMVFGLTACNSGGGGDEASKKEKNVTFKLGHIRPQDSVADKDMQAFAADVDEKSNGTLKMEIYPASQLGDYTVVQERVGIGDVEMQCAPFGTSMDKGFGISYIPYLVENWTDAKEYYQTGGVIAESMGKLLEKYNMKLLATYPLYYGGMIFSKEPTDYTNPNGKKNVKVRIPSMKTFEKTAEALGYIATPLAWADTFTSMQTGIVDGVIGAGAEGYYSNFKDIAKYYLPLNDHFEIWWMYVNKDKWDALSEEQQKALQESAQQMEEKRWGVAEAEEAEYEQLLVDGGTKILPLTDDQLKAFAEKCRKEVWPQVKGDFDEALFNEVTAGK